jgi:hypothetical protein
MPVALLALLALQSGIDGLNSLKARAAMQPQAIQDFIERRANCNHWGGEEPYDAERRREIEANWRDLGCDTIRGEEIFLRRYFAGRSDTLQLLDDTENESGW